MSYLFELHWTAHKRSENQFAHQMALPDIYHHSSRIETLKTIWRVCKWPKVIMVEEKDSDGTG